MIRVLKYLFLPQWSTENVQLELVIQPRLNDSQNQPQLRNGVPWSLIAKSNEDITHANLKK